MPDPLTGYARLEIKPVSWSSRCGSGVTNLTSIREVVGLFTGSGYNWAWGLIPGLGNSACCGCGKKKKKKEKNDILLLPHQGTVGKQLLWTRKRLSPKEDPAGTLALIFPASGTAGILPLW